MGTFAVYVSRFPGGDGKWEVSRGFGSWPRWGATGDRLYFIEELGRLAEVEVDLVTTFQPGPVVARIPAQAQTFGGRGFDVAAGGQQFLLPRSQGDQERPPSLLVIQNWR
jgi:hypothetical protein